MKPKPKWECGIKGLAGYNIVGKEGTLVVRIPVVSVYLIALFHVIMCCSYYFSDLVSWKNRFISPSVGGTFQTHVYGRSDNTSTHITNDCLYYK